MGTIISPQTQIAMTIESTIQRLTNDGEIVVQFLVDTVQGNIYNATVGHRLKSAEWLAALGGTIPEDALPKSASIRPKPKSKPKQDKPGKQDKPAKKPPVTEKQILHFDIARLIKDETRDGETIIEFLIRVVAKIERPGENFTPAARIRAARELLIRGYGSCIPGINRIQSGKTEELDSYLSKSIREYTGYGADPVRFLIDVMENKTPELDSKGAVVYNNKIIPQRKENVAFEGFKALQRVWAACELFRRGYDIRTDHITYADIQAYWNSQTPAAESADDDADDDEPDYSKLGITREAVEAEVAKMIASDAAKAAKTAATATPDATTTRADRRRQQRAAQKAQKSAAATAEKTAVAENPIDKTPAVADEPAATTRAERRHQQRAARKAQKPAVAKTPATAAAEMPATTQKPIDKMLADNTPMSATTASAIAQNPVVTEVIALNAPTVADTPRNLTRAARRREQRAAKKRSNPIDTANNAADAVNHANEPPNPTDVDTLANANPTRAERRRAKRAAQKAHKRANNPSNTPADNDNAPKLGRAERRRVQRAARKAQKRAGRHSDAPTGALTPKEQAEAEAFAHPGTRIYSAFIDIDPPKAPNPANDSAHNIPDDP